MSSYGHSRSYSRSGTAYTNGGHNADFYGGGGHHGSSQGHAYVEAAQPYYGASHAGSHAPTFYPSQAGSHLGHGQTMMQVPGSAGGVQVIHVVRPFRCSPQLLPLDLSNQIFIIALEQWRRTSKPQKPWP